MTRKPSNQGALKPQGEFWWLHPVAIMLFMHVPILLLAYSISDDTYQVLWKTPKYITGQIVALQLGCIGAFILGFFASPTKIRANRIIILTQTGQWLTNQATRKKIRALSKVSVTLTWVGILVWFGVALSNGLNVASLVGFLWGQQATAVRDSFEHLPGVTTMTQFGMAAVILTKLRGHLETGKGSRKTWLALLLVNAVRAFTLGERLALIEVGIPVVVISAHFWPMYRKPAQIKWLNLAPVLGGGIMFAVFTVFEAFRSWTFYSSKSDSLWSFGFLRLTGYYVTAVNNSALVFDRLPRLGLPIFTNAWLWKMPIVGSALNEVFNRGDDGYYPLLHSFANQEFNNPGGFLLPLVDFGVVFGLIYWAAFGFLVAKTFASFRNSNTLGLFLYPLLFVGLLDLSRVLYLTDSRAFPSLIFLLGSCFYMNGSRSRKKSVSGNRLVAQQPLPRLTS